MNGVDVALVVVLAACALRGYRRGFFRESFGVLGMLGGVAAALQFTTLGVSMLQERALLPAVTQTGVVFVGIFVVVHTLVNLIGVWFDRVAGAAILNHLAGTLLGVAKGGVVLAATLLLLHLLPMLPKADGYIMASTIARPLVAAASDVLRLGGDARPKQG